MSKGDRWWALQNFGHSLLKKYISQKASYPKILQKEIFTKSTYLPVFEKFCLGKFLAVFFTSWKKGRLWCIVMCKGDRWWWALPNFGHTHFLKTNLTKLATQNSSKREILTHIPIYQDLRFFSLLGKIGWILWDLQKRVHHSCVVMCKGDGWWAWPNFGHSFLL